MSVPRPVQPRAARLRWIILVLICTVVTAAVVGGTSVLALLYVLTDGLLAAVIVVVATLFGLFFVPVLHNAPVLPSRWRLATAAGSGLGILSLVVLAISCCGGLSQRVCIGTLVFMGLGGVIALTRQLQPSAPSDNASGPRRPGLPRYAPFLLLLLMPLLGFALLASTVPPGLLWSEEAYGYDVLEYHLQIPKEYYQAGEIISLPHNIYSHFPMNAEMLYLLAMVVKGDAIEAAILAKFFNVLLGVLFVLAAWLAGREYHPWTGAVCALLAGTMPWLVYLSGMAYVENGMLFYGMLSAACLCRFERRCREGQPQPRVVFAAGLFAGLACGFKYTAVPMIAAVLLLAVVILALRIRDARPLRLGLSFSAGALLTFSPWMIRNVVQTANPVFPLAYSVFGDRRGVWTDTLANRWHLGHQARGSEQPLSRRLALLKERVLTEERMGLTHDYSKPAQSGWKILPLPLALILPVFISRRRTLWDVLLLMVFVAQGMMWLCWTHLFARFAVVMIIPLVILMGRSMVVSEHRGYRLVVMMAVLTGVLMNYSTTWAFYQADLYQDGRPIPVFGRMELFYDRDRDAPLSYVVNHLDPAARVLMVGDARAYYYPERVDYCVVFSRNPFAEAVSAAASDEDIVRWLNRKGYDYVLVNRSEIQRLSASYGFWEALDLELFRRLEQIGLAPVKFFQAPSGGAYAVLYEVRKLD